MSKFVYQSGGHPSQNETQCCTNPKNQVSNQDKSRQHHQLLDLTFRPLTGPRFRMGNKRKDVAETGISRDIPRRSAAHVCGIVDANRGQVQLQGHELLPFQVVRSIFSTYIAGRDIGLTLAGLRVATSWWCHGFRCRSPAI